MVKNRLHLNIHCNDCPVSSHCLVSTLNQEQKEKINSIVTQMHILEAGEHLYFQQAKMEYIFALYSGLCKEYTLGEEGEEKINSFHFPGDLLALESLSLPKYEFSAMALEKSHFCAIPVKALFSLVNKSPVLLQRLLNIIIGKLQNKLDIPRTTNAKRRLAAFLLEFFHRNQGHTSLNKTMYLPMTQSDIGNRLGLAHETISRTFRLLQDQNIIKIENKKFCIKDINSLRTMAGLTDTY